tara:strand:+ start:462 stop:995 length:534 start_codon:yes stop_codon:yes gene_type:complete
MAKISNTTVYPNIIPTANDYVVLTDVNDDNATKTCTLDQIGQYIGLSVAQVTLTPLEILNSFTNPVTLIPAQGANKYIVPFGVPIVRNLADAAVPVGYFLGANARIRYDSTFFAEIPLTIFAQLAPYTGYGQMTYPTGGSLNLSDNFPLVFMAQGANPTLGNSNVVISIQYRIVEIA